MKKRWFACAICVVLFIVILVSILMGRELYIDNLIRNIIPNLRFDFCTKIVKVLTYLGDKYFMVLLVLAISGILYLKKYKAHAFVSCLNLFNIVILNKGIKYLVKRERPLDMLIEKDGYSFPSGHSMLSIGVYGLLIYFICKSNMSKKVKTLLVTILSIIIVIVGYTRLYLGVHYPSDIFGGYLITAAYLIVFISIIDTKLFKKVAKK